MKRFLIALQFLTIIPVGIKGALAETDIRKSASFFPAVGLVQGILLTCVFYVSSRLFQHDLALGIVLAALVLSNGGFHLDGLADTFDAIAARGDSERRLAVMKDSAVGPIGVVAILFALSLKFLALKSLTSLSTIAFYSSLILMPMVSKWAMVVCMYHGSPARKDGLGRIFIGRLAGLDLLLSTISLLLLSVLTAFLARSFSLADYISYGVSVIGIYIFCMVSLVFSRRTFGGLTGDVLGAVSEVSEIIFLLVVTAWSQLSI